MWAVQGLARCGLGTGEEEGVGMPGAMKEVGATVVGWVGGVEEAGMVVALVEAMEVGAQEETMVV